jgi:hypothetical protein
VKGCASKRWRKLLSAKGTEFDTKGTVVSGGQKPPRMLSQATVELAAPLG